MRLPFCILMVLGDVLDDGEIRFVESAETLEDAKRRIETLATSSPAEYVIYDEETGARLTVNALGKGKSRADGFEDFEQFGWFGYR